MGRMSHCQSETKKGKKEVVDSGVMLMLMKKLIELLQTYYGFDSSKTLGRELGNATIRYSNQQ